MKQTIGTLVALLLFSSLVIADTIPVITYKDSSVANTGFTNAMGMNADTVVKNINTENLKKTIADVKVTICEAVGKGDVKVYFAFDSKAETFGIGASFGAGIEVNFSCSAT